MLSWDYSFRKLRDKIHHDVVLLPLSFFISGTSGLEPSMEIAGKAKILAILLVVRRTPILIVHSWQVKLNTSSVSTVSGIVTLKSEFTLGELGFDSFLLKQFQDLPKVIDPWEWVAVLHCQFNSIHVIELHIRKRPVLLHHKQTPELTWGARATGCKQLAYQNRLEYSLVDQWVVYPPSTSGNTLGESYRDDIVVQCDTQWHPALLLLVAIIQDMDSVGESQRIISHTWSISSRKYDRTLGQFLETLDIYLSVIIFFVSSMELHGQRPVDSIFFKPWSESLTTPSVLEVSRVGILEVGRCIQKATAQASDTRS
ncbi:hypothetical protein Tco_1175156 [Tanacetum coccineum]